MLLYDCKSFKYKITMFYFHVASLDLDFWKCLDHLIHNTGEFHINNLKWYKEYRNS